MKKNSIVSSVATYFLIIFLVIGTNLLLAMPLRNIDTKILETGNVAIQENIEEYCRVFSNMVVALLVIVSLTLVIVGLNLRVNKSRNKGIYNAITLSGITVILYLIWFVVNIAS